MHLKTRVTLGVATVAAAFGAVLVPATTALAATPTLTVTINADAPTLNAQSGGTVTAVGSGYTPGATIALVQCSSVAADGSGCDQTPANARLVTADSNGGFTVANLVVTTGPKGNGTCGASSTCFIAGANVANTAEAGADDFKFDNLQVSPRNGLKNGTALNLSGAGYKPSATVYVSECTDVDPAKALQRCDINSVETYQTDANGAFTGVYHKTHTGPAVSEVGPYPCKPGSSCIVAGSDSITNPNAADAHIGGALVRFAQLTATKTVASGPKHVAKGAKFAVKGKVTAGGNALAGVKVTLFKVTRSGLTKLGKAKTTGSTGRVKFGSLTQKKTTKYELKTAANQTKYTAASASKPVKVATP
jgi:hypothetical protein